MPVTSGGGTTKKPKPAKKPPRTHKDQGDTFDKPSTTLGDEPVTAGTGSVRNAKSTPSKGGPKAQKTVKGTGSGGKTGSDKFSPKPKPGSREANKAKFGFGGTGDGGGDSGGVFGRRKEPLTEFHSRYGGVFDRIQRDGSRDIGLGGASDGGRLQQGFRDRDIVGSENSIEEYDGSQFSGGGSESTGGGGGGSGSALAGREAAGLANIKEGESVEELSAAG